MIPILLTIKGLYSYQDTQTIDFTTLTEGQLFGIFGAVGSGKSSILEAISFALYGETERLNLRDNRGYNMMNLKSNELLIDFIFKNHDDILYRFMVKGKRNSKNFEDVKSLDRSAYKKINNAWLPLENPLAEAILGLSYINFRRTIIIPQGKFQEFLQLKDKERTTMLKEIFALEKYEFSVQTIALEKKNNEALQNLNGQLLHLQFITQESILNQQTEVKSLETVVKKHKAEILVKENEIKEQEGVKTIFDDLENSQKQLDNLLANQQLQQQNATKIKNFEYCSLHFKDSFARKKELEAGINAYKKSLSKLDSEHQNCKQNLEELEKNSLNINAQFLKIDNYKHQVTDFNHLISIQKLKTETNYLNTRITDGQVYVTQTIANKTVAETKITSLKIQLKSQKNSLPNLSVLADLKTWFAQNEGFESSLKTIIDEIVVAELDLQKLTLTINTQLQNPVFASQNCKITAQNSTQTIQQLQLNLKTKNQVLQEQLAHYNLQKKLGEFSNSLHNGQPCMLCGATQHPKVLEVDDVEQHILAANTELKNNQKTNDDLGKIEKSILVFSQNQQLKTQQIQVLNNKLNQAQQKAQAHQQKFIWSNYLVTDKKLVDTQFTNAAEIQNGIKATEIELENEEKQLILATTDFEKYSQAIQGLKTQLTQKQAEYITLQKQIKVLAMADFEHLSEAQLSLKSTQTAQLISDIQSQHQQINQQLNQQMLAKIVLEEKQKNTLQNLSNDEVKYQNIAQQINSNFAKSSYQNLNEISFILGDIFDTEALKNQVILYNQQLHTTKENTQKLQTICAGKTFNALVYQQNLAIVLTLKQSFELANTNFITQKNALETAIKSLQQKLALENQLEKLQNRATNISTLKQLFSGSGFVSYVSQVYLQNLCVAANQRFYKLTRQQLRLEITDKNDFLVRDYLNNGKTRNVKTLSGGQTFQASLSLALALAQSVQQQNKAKQNFFFLDEGFGSLDKEALQVAFETLKQLRNESRIVGIISHVEDLQQEIDVYLTVTNDIFKGSQVKPSWE